jgi:hypothetical protein
VIGQTGTEYELILAAAAKITTRFCRNRIRGDDESRLVYQLRIDFEVPPELENQCPRGLISEAVQHVGTEILAGIRGPEREENRQSVMTNVVRLWVCYHSSSIEATMALLDEILAQRVPLQEIAVSSTGGDWHPYASLRIAHAA